MDSNRTADSPAMQPALFLQAQIVSVAGAADGYIIGDAGFKSGFPFGGELPECVSHKELLSVSGLVSLASSLASSVLIRLLLLISMPSECRAYDLPSEQRSLACRASQVG